MLLLILISHLSNTSQTSRAPASCTFVTSAAIDSYLRSKLFSTVAPIVHSNCITPFLKFTHRKRRQLTENSPARTITSESLHWLKSQFQWRFYIGARGG